MRSPRRTPPPIEVAAGEKVLAWARVAGGRFVAGTRDALYLPSGRLPSEGLASERLASERLASERLGWEQIEAADWDRELSRLRVSEVGRWGETRREHAFDLEDLGVGADRLLQLVRERITASVILVRHVPITGRRGVRVVARRAPSGHSPVEWVYEYDAGVDPSDPVVEAAAATALAAARDDLGLA